MSQEAPWVRRKNDSGCVPFPGPWHENAAALRFVMTGLKTGMPSVDQAADDMIDTGQSEVAPDQGVTLTLLNCEVFSVVLLPLESTSPMKQFVAMVTVVLPTEVHEVPLVLL